MIILTQDMETSALTPQKIASSNWHFSIPIYQRLFTWSEKQIKPLLQDLLYNCIISKSESHYYVGLLTKNDKNDLVDGQQRFIVMTLMALVMREYYLLWEGFLMIQDRPRLTFTARKEDERFLTKLIKGCSLEEGLTDEHSNVVMAEGIATISDFMRNLNGAVNDLGLEEKDIPKKENFAQYVFEHLAFFIQEIPEGYTPKMMNKYFESMNSTGRNLENYEILKVDLLKKANKDNDPKKYSRLVSLWNKASDMMKTIFGASEENCNKYIDFIKNKNILKQDLQWQEEPNSIMNAIADKLSLQKSNDNKRETRFFSFLSFTDFLLQVLFITLTDENVRLKLEHKINIQRFFSRHQLRETYNMYDEYIDAEKFIEDVYRYRIILDWSVIRIDGEGNYDLLSKNSEYSKLEQYEAMLYAGTSQNTYYHWIPLVLKSVYQNGFDAESLINELKQNDNTWHPIPNRIFDFREKIDTYYFRRLDYYLWEMIVNDDSTEQDFSKILDETNLLTLPIKEKIKKYKFHQYDSIEHLYPQNDNKQIDEVKWNSADNNVEDIKNGFGNLALISGGYNSTQNNQSLSHKFVNIADHIENNKIESIKLVIMYCCANGDMHKWTMDVAKKHGEQMFGFLKRTYQVIAETK